MSKLPQSPILPPLWQPEKHLADDDRVVVLTDIEVVWSRYYDFSPVQELFRVGIYDMTSGMIGFAKFGKDLAFDMLKGGAPLPPWGTSSLPFGIELHRRSHGVHLEGRFRGKVTGLVVEPAVLAIACVARKEFRQKGHAPNATIGMWDALEERAKSENAIEKAALSMPGIFKASDVRALVGNDKRINRVLQNMVEDGRLTPVTAKKYIVKPISIVARADWAS